VKAANKGDWFSCGKAVGEAVDLLLLHSPVPVPKKEDDTKAYGLVHGILEE
jgi:hypothetical protein